MEKEYTPEDMERLSAARQLSDESLAAEGARGVKDKPELPERLELTKQQVENVKRMEFSEKDARHEMATKNKELLRQLQDLHSEIALRDMPTSRLEEARMSELTDEIISLWKDVRHATYLFRDKEIKNLDLLSAFSNIYSKLIEIQKELHEK